MGHLAPTRSGKCIGVVDTSFLRRNRKYAFLVSFIIAAIVTPTPDVVNQLMMAGPLIVLYEISIFAVMLFGSKTFAGFDEENAQDQEDSTSVHPSEGS